jgi:RNA polymerase sigma-70 factor (ECF subfamily)
MPRPDPGVHPDHAELDASYRKPLMAFFRRRTRSEQEAEDLTQETFVRLLRSETFAGAEAADPFVFTVAANLLRDRARSAHHRHRQATQSLDERDDAPAHAELVEDRGPERVLLSREALIVAETALFELPTRTREIFVLFRFEHMSQREIAALYGVSVSAVEKHVAKALAHLSQRLGGA